MISHEQVTKHVSGVAMRRLYMVLVAAGLACCFFDQGALAQTFDKQEPNKQATDKPDLSKEPTLYVVGYAHLDTEWRWGYAPGINENLCKTTEDNFHMFGKYPHQVFQFNR